jgi:hypothetical protein
MTPMATEAGKRLQQLRWRQRQLAKLGLTIKQYDQYLAMPHWQLLRNRRLEEQRDKHGFNFCERCQKKAPEQVTRETALHVHHLTYERLGEELHQDLQIICRKCHEPEHGHDRKDRHYRPGERS